MDSILRTFRFAFRMLRKKPSSTAIAIFAMALGIGLTASMYAIVDGILLRGLPFDEAEELMHLERNHLERGIQSMEVPYHDLADWQQQQTSFEGLAGFTSGTVNLSGEGELPERYDGAFVTSNFLDVLGVQPALGRGFQEDDVAPDAAAAILLGHDVWHKRFGGDPQILGRVIRANSQPTTVIGVMPPDFQFPASQSVWIPRAVDVTSEPRGQADYTVEVFGRLRDGVSLDQASQEMSLIAQRLAEAYPDSNAGIGAVVKPYIHEYIGLGERQMLSIMMAGVLLVLLIACANVANILAGRATLRGRELAIRAALGSGRGHLVAQVIAESALLALAGAVLGTLGAHFAVRAFDTSLSAENRLFWFQFGIDQRVLLFVLLATVIAALMAAILPALQVMRPNVNLILQDSSRGTTGTRVGLGSRILVVVEVALSCALLVGSVLTVRGVLAVNNYDLKIDGEHVLTARLGLFEGDYPAGADWVDFYQRLQAEVTAASDVETAAIGTVIPADTEIGGGDRTRYERPDESYERPDQMPLSRLTAVGPGYFDTFGLDLLAGRDFSEADREGAPRVALVNQSFAEREWPGQSPLGNRIDLWMGDEAEAQDAQAGVVEVVGMVPDLRFAEFDNADDQQAIYLPFAQNPQRFAWIIVKTHGDPLAFTQGLRQSVLRLDADLPLYFVRSMDQVLTSTLYFPNLISTIFTTFGVGALLLACVGLYGVMAFAVAQRTQEMGVRLAFGAGRNDVLGLVLRQGLKQTAIGLLFGLPLGVLMALLLESMIFQVKAKDPVTFLTVTAILVTISTLATLLPARRAASVDPLVALRYE